MTFNPCLILCIKNKSIMKWGRSVTPYTLRPEPTEVQRHHYSYKWDIIPKWRDSVPIRRMSLFMARLKCTIDVLSRRISFKKENLFLRMGRDIALLSITFGGPLPIFKFISLRHPNKISVEDKPTFGPSRKRRPCAGFRLSVANSVSWTFVPIRPMRVEDSWPIPLSKAKLKMDPNNSGFRATLKFRMDGREQFGIKSLWGRLVACRMLAFRIHPYRR
mmetsp:Transcript_6402/g.15060  ORF Transcript_6402/g.15060 Transcript_6402/m.15060 type:complete len:218 (-) Transcript_6402:2945-3598(-)